MVLGFDSLYGNSLIKRNLASSFKNGKPAHAYLISGPKGSGKRTLAYITAAAFVCEKTEPPCGSCAHCVKAQKGLHPDIITVKAPEEKAQLPVAAIRGMCGDMYISPNEAEKKVYIIEDAEKMNTAAQNALLKNLEEPPAHCAVILVCGNTAALLPTILSRCVPLVTGPVSRDELKAFLSAKDCKENEIEKAIQISRGYIGAALEFLESGQNKDDKEFCEDLLYKLSGLNEYKAATASEALSSLKREEYIRRLALLASYSADIALIKAGPGKICLTNADRTRELTDLSKNFTVKTAAALTRLFNGNRTAAELNGNLTLLSTALICEGWEITH